MTAAEVVTLLRSLHRPTTWTWTIYHSTDWTSVSEPRKGCVTCHAHIAYGQAGNVSWPCETAALLDSIEATLTED